MKGIVGELGEIKNTLKSDAKPMKQRPYRLNPKYKEKIKEEINKMLQEGIIEPIKESEWISLIMIQEKKTRGIKLCVNLRKLNDACGTNPFLTPFKDEVLESVGG